MSLDPTVPVTANKAMNAQMLFTNRMAAQSIDNAIDHLAEASAQMGPRKVSPFDAQWTANSLSGAMAGIAGARSGVEAARAYAGPSIVQNLQSVEKLLQPITNHALAVGFVVDNHGTPDNPWDDTYRNPTTFAPTPAWSRAANRMMAELRVAAPVATLSLQQVQSQLGELRSGGAPR